jgi:hypothetical protein
MTLNPQLSAVSIQPSASKEEDRIQETEVSMKTENNKQYFDRIYRIDRIFICWFQNKKTL